MKLTLVLLAAAASAQKPAPPVVTVAPVAIPAVRAVGGDYGVRSEAKVVPLLVEVSVGGTILWSGAMRVNAVGARYSSSFSQAPDMPCARPSYRNVFENSLSLNIRAAYDSEGEADRFEVNVSWARPAKGETCETSGKLTAQIQQMIELRPGKSIEILGDGDLRVKITRK